MSHARWLTTANRILRLYVATEEPSFELKLLAEYVIKVYASTWFLIKYKSACKYEPQHLFHLIQSSRYLQTKFKNIIDKVIQRNAYFAHAENVLIGMLANDRKHIRELALRRILNCRTLKCEVRDFFEASDYTELINWQTVKVTEPPLTKSITEAELKEMIINISKNIEVLNFPCHTQAVERHIKLVTEASSSVCGNNARDGLIRAKIACKKAIPKMETKKILLNKFLSCYTI